MHGWSGNDGSRGNERDGQETCRREGTDEAEAAPNGVGSPLSIVFRRQTCSSGSTKFTVSSLKMAMMWQTASGRSRGRCEVEELWQHAPPHPCQGTHSLCPHRHTHPPNDLAEPTYARIKLESASGCVQNLPAPAQHAALASPHPLPSRPAPSCAQQKNGCASRPEGEEGAKR